MLCIFTIVLAQSNQVHCRFPLNKFNSNPVLECNKCAKFKAFVNFKVQKFAFLKNEIELVGRIISCERKQRKVPATQIYLEK